MPSLPSTLCLGAFFVFVLLQYRKQQKGRKSSLPLPPGPPADPLIGHLRLLSSKKPPWELFHEVSQKYGDVAYLNAAGKSIVLLNSEDAAKELLEKHGAIHSDRPPFAFFTEMGWKGLMMLLPYGESFLRQRRIAQQPFTNQKVAEYRDIQIREVNRLLEKLLDCPEEFMKHIHIVNTSIMVDLIYGHRINSEDDEYLKLPDVFSEYVSYGRYASIGLLDEFPLLKHLPSWFPGAWFIPVIQGARAIVKHSIKFPIEDVRRQIAAGKASPSIASSHLEEFMAQGQLTDESLFDIEMATHMTLGGGTETTWGTLIVFIAAMVLYPEVQQKAQQEIDSVVGDSRLPDFTDRDSLPYINAVMHEIMRWRPIVPNGVPHVSAADDEFRGMFIPKGSTIFANTWSMALDERVYQDPTEFKPERYLPAPNGAGEPLSSSFVFGFGRRKCPGQNLADANVWLAMARLLAVFNISKAKDAHGKDVEVDLKFVSTGLSSFPEPFLCDIRPRSERAVTLTHEAQRLNE